MESVKTILLIRLSSIGDIVLTTPVIRYLSLSFPEALLDFCTREPFLSLLAGDPRLSALHTPESLPTQRYDLVVDLQNNRRSRALCRSLRAKRMVRYKKPNIRKWLLVHAHLNLFPRIESVVTRYLRALDGICTLPADVLGCELYCSPADQTFASCFAASSQPTLAICFGARHYTKRYPSSQFARVVSHLLDAQPFRILLLGGADEIADAKRLLQALPVRHHASILNLAGQCTLMQSAAVLAAADMVLGNDTGLMHIASAFKRPLYLLFGSSVSQFGFLPYHVPVRLFEVPGLSCRPCSHIGRDQCPKGEFICMEKIDAAAVARAILDDVRSSDR